MKSIHLVNHIWLVCACHLISSFVAFPCPIRYEPVGSYCLRFNQNRLTWNDARRKCLREGAHLAVIDTATKKDLFISYLTRYGSPSVWLDGKDTNGRRNWIWYSTGVSVDRFLWASDQPNNYKYHFICQYEPATSTLRRKRSPIGTRNGAWGAWASWSTCSVTCGYQGLRSRTRLCDNPAPVFPGKPCLGDDRQTKVCHPPQCPTCQVHNVPGAMSSVSAARINENEQVKYYCLPEYKLVGGSLIRTCQANGTLSNEEPQCKKCCGKARYIVNGYPNTSATLCYGDHVNYLCDRGYKSSNSTPITCLSPCEWKYIPLPKCEPDGKCDYADIAAPQGGYKACTGDELNRVCYMHCSSGLQYSGGHDLFECSAKTGWVWKVRLQGGAIYVRSNVGACQVSDSASDLLMWLTGLGLTTASPAPDAALREKIKREMVKKLLAANICSYPCKIQNFEIEQAHGYVN